MKKYMKNYIQELENCIKEKRKYNEKEIEELKIKISYFQHERLIHLLVTIAFAFLTLIFMALGMLSYLFLIPFAILIVFLIFYIFHYFYLENSVQYMYKLYDQMMKISKK